MAAALALLPMAHSFPYFVISASLFGMGFGAGQPATMAILIDHVRPEQRGLATGTYYIGFDVGYSIGSILLGVVSQYWGFGVMWPLAAACTLLGLAGLLVDRAIRPAPPRTNFAGQTSCRYGERGWGEKSKRKKKGLSCIA